MGHGKYEHRKLVEHIDSTQIQPAWDYNVFLVIAILSVLIIVFVYSMKKCWEGYYENMLSANSRPSPIDDDGPRSVVTAPVPARYYSYASRPQLATTFMPQSRRMFNGHRNEYYDPDPPPPYEVAIKLPHPSSLVGETKV